MEVLQMFALVGMCERDIRRIMSGDPVMFVMPPTLPDGGACARSLVVTVTATVGCLCTTCGDVRRRAVHLA
jgi:hypothetical protein